MLRQRDAFWAEEFTSKADKGSGKRSCADTLLERGGGTWLPAWVLCLMGGKRSTRKFEYGGGGD